MNKTKYTHEELKALALSDFETRLEYDNLNDEFQLFHEMLKARLQAGKTQEDIAKAMNTTKAAVSRLEHGGGKTKHSPNLGTLRRYAKALNCDLKIQLVPHKV